MKYLQTPFFWIAFGIFGFPILCLCAGIMMEGTVYLLRPSLSDRLADEVWDFTGFLFGMPLAVVSALCAWAWRRERFALSRLMAFLGGTGLGGYLMALVLPRSIYALLGDFAFNAPPLLWAGCLVMFAVVTRVPE